MSSASLAKGGWRVDGLTGRSGAERRHKQGVRVDLIWVRVRQRSEGRAVSLEGSVRRPCAQACMLALNKMNLKPSGVPSGVCRGQSAPGGRPESSPEGQSVAAESSPESSPGDACQRGPDGGLESQVYYVV